MKKVFTHKMIRECFDNEESSLAKSNEAIKRKMDHIFFFESANI